MAQARSSDALVNRSLSEEADRLRKEAQGTPPGVERNNLIRRARSAEAASRMKKWVNSPGLKSPG
jgi:hypothetical protein